MRFQNNDTVKIAKNSRYYRSNGRNNPRDTEGVLIIDTHRTGNFVYKVNWGEGRAAWYNDSDLRLVRRGA